MLGVNEILRELKTLRDIPSLGQAFTKDCGRVSLWQRSTLSMDVSIVIEAPGVTFVFQVPRQQNCSTASASFGIE